MPPRRQSSSASLLLVSIGMLVLALGLTCWGLGGDQPLHHALRIDAAYGPALGWVSMLGGVRVQGPLALAAIVWLAVKRRRRDAVWLFLAIASGRLIVEGIKIVVARPRPPISDRLEAVTSWSFPSAHSAGAMMTGLMLATVFGGRLSGLAAALALALLIGWSRAALGVHWPGDVLAGWGFGLAWTGLALRFR